MRRLAIDLTLFVLLQVTIVSVLIARAANHDAYMWAAADKHARLCSLQGPRVVIVGGSSAAFGFDSEAISGRTGYQVTNMALHAGLGLSFMLREVAREVRAGDIVLVAPEYPVMCGNRPQSEVVLGALRAVPETARCVTSQYLPTLLDGGLAYAGASTRPEPSEAPYARSAFDATGAICVRPPRSMAPRLRMADLGADPRRIGRGIAECNSFYRHCRRRGARAFFVYPPIGSDRYTRDRETIQEIERRMTSGLEMPRLGSPEDAVLPPECFYDTANHLTAEGAARRTEAVVNKLLRELPVAGR